MQPRKYRPAVLLTLTPTPTPTLTLTPTSTPTLAYLQGAHLAWNALASFNIIRVIALGHCALFVFNAIRNRGKRNAADAAPA